MNDTHTAVTSCDGHLGGICTDDRDGSISTVGSGECYLGEPQQLFCVTVLCSVLRCIRE